jgi:glycosyltransferase involved in cell wall biosynthesis
VLECQSTNVPGCKDVVVNEVTGLLCEAKNVNDLAMKMEEMLNYDEKKERKWP